MNNENLKRTNVVGLAIGFCLAILSLAVESTQFAMGLQFISRIVVVFSIDRKNMDID